MARKIAPLKIGVLLSGGLDSAALVSYYLRRNFFVQPIFIRCGLRWEAHEIKAAKQFLRHSRHKRLYPLTILSMPLGSGYRSNWSHTQKTPGPRSLDTSVYLPGRNLLLTTRAFLFLNSRKVTRLALGILKGNPFEDAKPSFVRILEKILGQSFSKKLTIETPFRLKDKAQVIQAEATAPLHFTFSCISPIKKRHCGWCNKCTERKRAFKTAKVHDKTRYARG
jgi:7-cyano-7-deazaguanine synthase